MSLSFRDLPITDAFYTFVDGDGSAVHIAASFLVRELERRNWPVTRCHMDPEYLAAMDRGDMGIEVAAALRLPEAALERPGVIGEWGGTHIQIDGAHRAWRRRQRGDTWFPAYVVPEPGWRAFVIHDIPGSAEEWRAINKQEYRTPEFELLMRLLGGAT